MNRRKRVVVTGAGVVAPNGIGKEAFWEGCCLARSGVKKLEWAADFGLRSRVAAPVDRAQLHTAARDLGIEPGETNDLVLLGLVAGREAQVDAGTRPWGLVAATAISYFTALEKSFISGQRSPRPDDFFFDSLQVGLARGLGLAGPAATVSTGCTSSHDAFGYAYRKVSRGQWDSALVVAADSPLGATTAAAFDVLGALAFARNHLPTTASRPFDAERDGFVPGEGAAAMLIESADAAAARGARPYAEVLGFGSVNSGYHMTGIPADGWPIFRSIQAAAEDGGHAARTLARVNYINSHGSGTPMNDRAEAAAFRRAFGDRLATIPVNSTKSLIGHALGAAGLIELVHAVLSLRGDTVTPNINLEYRDPDIDLYLPKRLLAPYRIDALLKTGSGFSGIHSALILSRFSQEGT
jgi:3-oxoacyl-(acyl-carrier-protein) synthase